MHLVIWRHLANANKTPYRGPQGPREFERNKYGGQRPAGLRQLRPEDEYLLLVICIMIVWCALTNCIELLSCVIQLYICLTEPREI